MMRGYPDTKGIQSHLDLCCCPLSPSISRPTTCASATNLDSPAGRSGVSPLLNCHVYTPTTKSDVIFYTCSVRHLWCIYLFGAGVLVVLLVFVLSRTLFWRRSEERKRMAADAKTLQDYDPTHKPEFPSGQVCYNTAAVIMAFPLAQGVTSTDPNQPHHRYR